MRLIRGAIAVLAASVIACTALPGGAAKGPSGPVGDVARMIADLRSANTSASDPRFDDFLELVDLKKAYPDLAGQITDQIKSGRAAVTKTAAAASAGRLASVRGVFGESVVLEFAETLGSALDEFTKQSATHEFPRLPPSSHTDDGADTVTTSTRSQTMTLKSVGPQVTLTIVWTYSETTTSKESGATLATMSEDRTLNGAINVCPDDQGATGAFLDVKGNFTAAVNGRSTSLTMSSRSVFTGYVNDSASLTRVHHVLQDKQEWHGAGGDGNYDMTFAADSAADAAGSFAGSGLDQSSASGSINASDAAALTRASKLGSWSFVLNDHSLDKAYQQAQRLWKNGRCVVITAPDFDGAETPLDVGKQNESQYDKDVDVSSETKFPADIKFRYGGIVRAPITTSLSGQKSLTPNRVDTTPSQLTYKAPDEDGKKATATLKSVSKRGIGTLVLDFHTGGALTLTIEGEVRGDSNRLGTVRILDTVKIGPLEFKQLGGGLWQATGSWTAQTSSLTSAAGSTDTCTGSETGTVTLRATVETRAGKRVWAIDPSDADAQGTGTTTCQSSLGDQTLRGVTIPGKRTFPSDGGAAELFLGNLEPFTVPADAGSVRVHGSTGGPGGTFTSDGTAKAAK